MRRVGKRLSQAGIESIGFHYNATHFATERRIFRMSILPARIIPQIHIIQCPWCHSYCIMITMRCKYTQAWLRVQWSTCRFMKSFACQLRVRVGVCELPHRWLSPREQHFIISDVLDNTCTPKYTTKYSRGKAFTSNCPNHLKPSVKHHPVYIIICMDISKTVTVKIPRRIGLGHRDSMFLTSHPTSR